MFDVRLLDNTCTITWTIKSSPFRKHEHCSSNNASKYSADHKRNTVALCSGATEHLKSLNFEKQLVL